MTPNPRIREELTDRFGPPPPPATNLLALARLRPLAETVGLASIVQKPTALELTFQDPPSLDPQALVEVVQRDPEGIELLPGNRHPGGEGSPSPPLLLRLRIAPSRFTTTGPLPFLQRWLSLVAEGSKKFSVIDK